MYSVVQARHNVYVSQSQEHKLSVSDSTAMSKCLVKDGADFAEDAFALLNKPDCIQPRPASTTEGPADLLAMDVLLAQAIDVLHRHENKEKLNAAIFDRDYLAKWYMPHLIVSLLFFFVVVWCRPVASRSVHFYLVVNIF